MELREFISTTLADILGGIADAQGSIERPGQYGTGAINPCWDHTTLNHLQTVEFDVAVTAADHASGGGKAGVKVWALEVGGQKERSLANTSVSRIAFKVPILPPAHWLFDGAPRGYTRPGDNIEG